MNSIQERAIVNGKHFICTGEMTLVAATTTLLHIKTGENNIIFDTPLNLNMMAGHVKILVKEDAIASADGSSNGLVANNNRILKTAPTTEFFSAPILSNEGVEIIENKIFGSSDNATKIAQRTSSLGADYGMVIFEANKSYIISFENQDADDTAEIAYSMTFIEYTDEDKLI